MLSLLLLMADFYHHCDTLRAVTCTSLLGSLTDPVPFIMSGQKTQYFLATNQTEFWWPSNELSRIVIIFLCSSLNELTVQCDSITLPHITP